MKKKTRDKFKVKIKIIKTIKKGEKIKMLVGCCGKNCYQSKNIKEWEIIGNHNKYML